MEKLLAALFVLAVGFTYWPNDVWRSKIFVGQILSIAALGYFTARRVHWTAALALVSSLLSCMWVFGFPLRPYRHADLGAQFSLEAQAMEGAFFILVLVVPMLFTTRRMRDGLRAGFAWLCVLDSLFVIGQWAAGYDYYNRGGFFGNHSLNACMIAATWALVDDRDFQWIARKMPEKWSAAFWTVFQQLAMIAPPIAVLLGHSSMGLGVLCVVLAAFVFARMRFRVAFLSAIVMWALIAAAAYPVFHHGEGLFHDGDRLGIWSMALRWWAANASHAFGTGQGTFFILGPHAQIEANLHVGHWWLWAHNDWLQVLFEQGVVGLAAFAALFICACRHALKNGRVDVFAAICGYGAMSLGNYPARLEATAALMVLLVATAFLDQNPLLGNLMEGKNVSDEAQE